MNEDLFVRKDVYDANSARLEALMEKTAAQNQAAIEELRSEVRTWNAKLEGYADALGTAIDAVNKRMDDGFTRISVTFSVIQVGVAVILWLLSR